MNLSDMLRKVKKYHSILECRSIQNEQNISDIFICPSDYKDGHTPPDFSCFLPLNADKTWGSGNDSHAWFTFTIPAIGKDGFLHIKTGKDKWETQSPQFIVYIDGKLCQGVDSNHCFLPINDQKEHNITVYGYTGPRRAKAEFYASIGEWVPCVRDLCFDMLYPLQMLAYLNEESNEYAQIVFYLYQAVSKVDLLDDQRFLFSVETAKGYLDSEFYGKYCKNQDSSVICIGHTHIDCAWKWTLKQTREKVQRSFSTVLRLMERYPEYKFMSSQPLLYSFMKEEAPEQYSQIIDRVKEGRWEPEGGMWVEPDCNLPSGESLVRQLIYGKAFFKNEFGVDSHILWLPDVFGYSAALPQILRKSGIDWFVTSKISWNDTNRMPYDTFLWKGIDGTAINSYFLTAQNDDGTQTERHTTYNGIVDANMISGTYKRYQQKYLSNEALLTFGFGDGGGGPTEEHLELLRRSEKGVPGSPNTKIEFVSDFLSRLESKIKENPLVPTWQGELYLEFHRGTYTTLAKNKRNNRKAEFLYHNAELWSVLANRLLKTPIECERLHHGWQTILTNQFHDIIPGSSIKEVYEQSDIDYNDVFTNGNEIEQSALTQIASNIDASAGYVVYNPNSFSDRALVKIDGKTVITKAPVPSVGYAVVNDFIDQNHIKISEYTVETDRFTVTFNKDWQIISLFDKQNDFEILQKGTIGNELRIYADHPDCYDAWEWQEYARSDYISLIDVTDVKVMDDGARKGIKIVRTHQHSTITQIIWFYDTISQITFETEVDWHEHHQMLKAAFPVNINSDHATYEIQFGNVQRPTYSNTSWDAAKYEVCAHKYADYSDGGYGVGLINDCKYGHDIHNGVMQLSLLRSPTFPNPDADQGIMKCVYAICPHKGDFLQSDVIKQSYFLNNPVTAVAAAGKQTTLPLCLSLVSVNAPNVICETVKPAENGDGFILRFYETNNAHTKADICFGIPVKEVVLCDLMENEIAPITVNNGNISIEFKGYEIITVKVKE